MARDREVICKHYMHENGTCKQGRTATHHNYCQTCKLYDALPGGRPARPNRKREKLDKIAKDKRDWRVD